MWMEAWHRVLALLTTLFDRMKTNCDNRPRDVHQASFDHLVYGFRWSVCHMLSTYICPTTSHDALYTPNIPSIPCYAVQHR